MTEKYPLNLPQTDFPMKANSATREVETQKFWDDNKVYEKNLEREKRPTNSCCMTDLPI